MIMKQIGTLVLAVLTFYSMTSFGQTQMEMNQQAYEKYAKADSTLNVIYKRIKKECAADTSFIKNLKSSEVIWVKFRDAEMAMKYPDKTNMYYGSVFPMCWSMDLEYLTNERIKHLMLWVEGIEEGDVCTGSVKVKTSDPK